ncbi:hypothetical protein CCO03_17240 [Comamonas serinivorans]|uniref:Lipopolysaccharide assembly protein A domain-containing protein n=1 Tax=Comamonas serinivorans TaxID=1082851 RepID=A0A1Y0ERI4_9BURK|nr:LapA family protein [Comamonas serinivorans]ARU06186.1 hypothetical protein CCO03_17240 [Comamonas serinivorans]
MQTLLRVLRWALKAAVFFTLFAFALNNQQDASVHFFFGQQWRMPMALIVLVSFAIGLAVGVLGMLSTLWRRQTPKAAQARRPEDETLLTGRPPLVDLPEDSPHGL